VILWELTERLRLRDALTRLCRVSVSGAERVPPGACILVANHESVIDAFFLSLATRRRVRFMAKAELWRYPLVRWGMVLWVELPKVLAEAIEATLPPREDRDLDAPLFPGVGADRLRTAIARACKAAGIPRSARTTCATAGSASSTGKAEAGPRSRGSSASGSSSVTDDTYTHVMADDREADYDGLIASLAAA